MEIYRRIKTLNGEYAGVFKLVKIDNKYYWKYYSQKRINIYPIIIADCHPLSLNVEFHESHL